MASIGDLFVSLEIDNKKANRGIDQTKKKMKGAEKDSKKFSLSLKNLFAGVAFIAVAKKIATVSKVLVDAQSEAEETRNKFNVVFESIGDEAVDMSKKLAESYGLSQQASQEMLSGTGDLLTGLNFTSESAFDLSKQVLALGTDLASFSNFSGGAKGAVEALTKGLLGERESMKALGIAIGEADVKAELLKMQQEGLTFETIRQAKAQATLRLALRQSKNAIGDFERSSDSYANQVRIAEAKTADLRAELGKALIPAAKEGAKALANLASKLTDYIREHNEISRINDALKEGTATLEDKIAVGERELKQTQKLIQKQREYLDGRRFGRSDAIAELRELETKSAWLFSNIKKQKEELAIQNERIAKEKKEKDQAEARRKSIQENNELRLGFEEQYTNKLFELRDTDAEALNREKEEAIARADELGASKLDILAYYEEQEAQLRDDSQQKDKDRFRDQLSSYSSYGTQLLGLVSTLQDGELSSIEARKNAKIEALDKEVLGEEEYNQQVAAIEKEAALESWRIQKEQLAIQKATSLIEIATNTAIGVSKALAQGGIFGIATGALVSAAGIAQAGLVLSQPEPPKPKLAKGAYVEGSASGTSVIVGEAGDEEIFGMGSDGAPRRQKFAAEVAEMVAATGGSGETVIINITTMMNLATRSQQREMGDKVFESYQEAKRRRGAV